MAVVLVGIGLGGGEARAGANGDWSEFLEPAGSSRQLTKTTGPSKPFKAEPASQKRAKQAPKRVAKKAGAKSRATKRAVRSKRRR